VSAVVLEPSPVEGEHLVVTGGAVVGAIRANPTPPRGRATFTAWVAAGGVFRPTALPLRPWPSRRAAMQAVVEAAQRQRERRARAVAA
jgi:hypothetical protein